MGARADDGVSGQRSVTTTGWNVFELQTPFLRGTDNLMVTQLQQLHYSTDGLCVYGAGGNRTLSFHDSAYGDPLTGRGRCRGHVSTKVPDLHLALQSSTPTSYSISGHVLEGSLGLAGVTVTPSPSGAAVTTDSSGAYTITGLGAGTYTITPAKSGYVITPASATVSVGPDKTNVDFAGGGHHADGTCDQEADFAWRYHAVSWARWPAPRITGSAARPTQRGRGERQQRGRTTTTGPDAEDDNHTGLRHRVNSDDEEPWSSAVFSTVAPTALVYIGDTDKRQDESLR